MAEKSERAQREEKILQFWKDNKIFEKSLEKSSPKGEFVFYDGPPFATGLPHYGHILPGTIKDVIPRYKTMRGYHVPRRWGWDCHGLPIENLVEKELGLETKKDIEKFGIEEFNKRARASVLRFDKEWKEIIPRTGRWIDMERAYKTMDASYTESVWWSFHKLYEQGLVSKGFKSMHLCPHCGTTLSNFEVNLGYKDITDLTVTVEFELIDEPKTYLLAWTTTPWTLPGNVALAVNPELEYVTVEGEEPGNNYIVAKNLVEKVFKNNFKVLRTFSGKDLIGKRYKTVFDYYAKEGRVFGADFVTAEDGTGIVHIAPGFGEDDYQLSLKEKLPLIQHVDTDGRFKPEVKEFAGKLAKPKGDHQSGDVEIIKYLASKNLLFAKEKIVHSYPHCWRCDTPLLNYASSSWFINVTAIKDKLVKNNSGVKWVPEDIREGRFGKWLEGARDWAVSRSRFWGTPIPVWQNATGEKTLVLDSVNTLKKFQKKSSNRYFIMRHGETEGNLKKIWCIDPNVPNPLTERGIEEVRTAAQSLKDKNIDLVLISPYGRVRKTAQLVAEVLGISEEKLITDDRLVEWNVGKEFDGKPLEDFFVERRRSEDRYAFKKADGESYTEVFKRAGEFMYEIDSKYSGKNILIITHGAVSRALDALGEGVSYKYIDPKHRASVNFKNAEVRESNFVPLPHNENYELDLHRPYIDEVVLEKDGEEYRRIPEVFDTWYDSGSVPFASRAAKDLKQADFIAEGLDQTRGWFYTMLVLSTALFGKSPYKQVVVNGLVLAEDGKKMSKRLNNYPELTDVLDKYGADALRFYLMSSPAVHADDLVFSEKGLDEILKKNINRLENVLSFYELYVEEQSEPTGSESILDKWIDARFKELLENVTENLENYKIDRACRPINEFIDDLSTWYLRRSRNRPEALTKLREILLGLSRVIAPIMPFIAEDIYTRLRKDSDPESVHLCEWPHVKKRLLSAIFSNSDDNLIENMVETRKLASLALEQRTKANIKVRQPLNELRIKRSGLGEEYLELIKEELNVKNVVIDPSLKSEVELDTKITPELEEEGRLREEIRSIQDMRKEKGLRPQDKLKISVPEDKRSLYERFKSEIVKTTNVEF